MHSNRVRQLRSASCPTRHMDQLGWIGIELATPMHHVAFFIGDIEIELGMRVCIVELRNDALHGDGMAGIIRNTGAVMRGSGNGRRNDTHDEERKQDSFIFFIFEVRYNRFYPGNPELYGRNRKDMLRPERSEFRL